MIQYFYFLFGLLIFKLIQFFFSIKKFPDHNELLEKKLPDSLNKIFYMDNNQMANDYYIIPRNGIFYIGDNRYAVKVTQSSAFTFDGTIIGTIYIFIAFLIDYSYVFTLTKNDTEAKIDIYLFNFIKIPDFFIIFKMTYQPETLMWKRESYIPLLSYFIKPHVYYMIPQETLDTNQKIDNPTFNSYKSKSCCVFV
jgi:hypothetical protein